jgi:hypothetical protein
MAMPSIKVIPSTRGSENPLSKTEMLHQVRNIVLKERKKKKEKKIWYKHFQTILAWTVSWIAK